MEEILVTRVNEGYCFDSDIRRLINYVVRDKKTQDEVRHWGTRGLPMDIKRAVRFIKETQKMMGKAQGRRMNHIVISFRNKELDIGTVCEIAEVLADFFFKEYQLVYGIHEDTEHKHIHFAINTLSYETGKKWHKSIKEFSVWLNCIKDLAEKVIKDSIGIYSIEGKSLYLYQNLNGISMQIDVDKIIDNMFYGEFRDYNWVLDNGSIL